ncbi:MAG: acyl-CoA dehydrogenase, partial [Alphaproteobacteria bacterium]|nr:acyl-CoA dehydrogenase [Alphaproteobacteria bacterium]
DGPKGTRGISLFLVPKFLADAGGRLGPRNRVSCDGLEAKMGIHGCSTCTMSFDRATGWLVGEAHQGLKAMFSMMNTERLSVGIQGLAVAEASRQNAVAYARERRQGRSAAARSGDSLADPIIVHPDVRRMLMTQRALVEGNRALGLWTARALDLSERHPDEVLRRKASDFVALMTPVVKASLTDAGSEVANLGMQILGGHGYIRGNGQEQFVRDVRITQIYEGTNGIQAIDLLGRKVLQQDLLSAFTEPVRAFLAEAAKSPELAEFTGPVERALSLLNEAVDLIRKRVAANPEEPLAVASEFLALLALTAQAYLWARAARIALQHPNEEFYQAKLTTARFFMARILPRSGACHAAILAGAAPVMNLDAESY